MAILITLRYNNLSKMLMKTKLLLLSLFLYVGNLMVIAQNATITGTITDSETKDFLIGTTITLKDSNKERGTISDANGHYTLYVPKGKHTIIFSFIGYKSQEISVDLKANEAKELNITMSPDSKLLTEVVVSAQAKGQRAAITRQLNATGIMNAVSEEKLHELPDVNVADAIGRLPGLMIQRDGGEGQKIIIRGLDPKYNTVAINGMNAPSTSSSDRSTDLNMISPDMIAGAEVLKASTADKDADGLGGTVNLIMKDAPRGFKLNVTGETGYHSLISGFGRYKGGIVASNRFFNDRLGAIFTASADQTDRSNDTFNASYKVNGNTPTPGLDYTKPWTTGVGLESNLEKRQRFNINLNLDFTLGNGSKIKMSNLFSRMNRDRDIRQKRYDLEGTRLRFQQTDRKSHNINLTNILQGDFNILGATLSAGVGRSNTDTKTPYNHQLQFRLNAPFTANIDDLAYQPPYLIANAKFVKEDDLGQYYLYEATFNDELAKETEYSAWLDFKKPFNFSDKVNGYIKFGGKFRQKERSLETNRRYRRMDLAEGYEPVFENMPNLTHSEFKSTYIGINDFLDTSFKSNDFLNNKYKDLNIDFALDHNTMRNFYDVNQDAYGKILTSKILKDYNGKENLWAGYIMSEINFGKYITFIPGVRYDFSDLKYNAYSGSNVPDNEDKEHEFEYERTSDKNHYGYWLPQIHLRIKPVNWIDIRLAYTETLSRPDYDLLAPRTIIKPNVNEVVWSRTNLKPALSKNYDVILTFYQPDYGIFTVSGFYKKIKNFTYTRTAYILEGTTTDPTKFDIPVSMAGGSITYPLNSPFDATLKGLEFDLQLQFRKLHNILKGVVFSANLTLMDSNMSYFETLKSRVKNPNFTPGGTEKPFMPVNSEIVYEDRLLNQPSLLFNVSLGYDYKKFSGRISCNYQDGVLVSEQHRQDAADVESTRPFMKWDMQLKYKLTNRFSLYATLSNFTKSSDRRRRDITNYPVRVEYYGSAAYVGFKYDIFK